MHEKLYFINLHSKTLRGKITCGDHFLFIYPYLILDLYIMFITTFYLLY